MSDYNAVEAINLRFIIGWVDRIPEGRWCKVDPWISACLDGTFWSTEAFNLWDLVSR